jgi:hypothetical protein
MKVFFTLLLLTNIVFAAFQWLVPYEQLMPQASNVEVAEKLKLLDEVEVSAAPRVEPQTPQRQTVTSTAANLSGPLCYTLGPFKEQQMAQEAAAQFKRHKISITSRSSVEKEYMGLMVYIDGHDSRRAAIDTAESLKEKGIRDYIIVNEPGKSNILSLGVFGLKKNADGLTARVAKLGFQVKSEPRYRNRTIYWLDYSQQENEDISQLIDQLKQEQGISRISRQCS